MAIMITDEARGELVAVTEHGILLVGRIREAWCWLREAVVPGRQGWTQGVLSEGERERLDARAFAERAYRTANLRVGLSALAPAASAANLSAVDARAALERDLPDLAAELLRTVTGLDLPPAPDPTVRNHPGRCRLCLGRGALPIPSTIGEDWIKCPVIERCRTCRSPTLCACEPADARVHQALGYISQMLPQVRSLEQASDAVRELERAHHRACTGARANPPHRLLFRVECPACHGRSLHLDADSDERHEWGITCTTKACRCTGPDCKCGRTSTHRGAEHRWMAANDGWRELNAALDADSQARLAAELAALELGAAA